MSLKKLLNKEYCEFQLERFECISLIAFQLQGNYCGLAYPFKLQLS